MFPLFHAALAKLTRYNKISIIVVFKQSSNNLFITVKNGQEQLIRVWSNGLLKEASKKKTKQGDLRKVQDFAFISVDNLLTWLSLTHQVKHVRMVLFGLSSLNFELIDVFDDFLCVISIKKISRYSHNGCRHKKLPRSSRKGTSSFTPYN